MGNCRVPFPTLDMIDFPVSYAWARHFGPSLPPIDDRTPRQRRVEEWIDEAWAAIQAEVRGEQEPAVPSQIQSRDPLLSSRVDYLQAELAEHKRQIRDISRLLPKRSATISHGGVEV